MLKPTLIVLLGASAAVSVLKRNLTIERMRGAIMELPQFNAKALVLVHPSYRLRIPEEQRSQA